MNDYFSIYDDMTVAEKLVAEFLKLKGIHWIFEQPLFVFDEKGRPRVWNPDFFLPQLGIFIEVIGNPNWKQDRKFNKNYDYDYRKKIYEQNYLDVIFSEVDPSDNLSTPKWAKDLIIQVRTIHKNRTELMYDWNY